MSLEKTRTFNSEGCICVACVYLWKSTTNTSFFFVIGTHGETLWRTRKHSLEPVVIECVCVCACIHLCVHYMCACISCVFACLCMLMFDASIGYSDVCMRTRRSVVAATAMRSFVWAHYASFFFGLCLWLWLCMWVRSINPLLYFLLSLIQSLGCPWCCIRASRARAVTSWWRWYGACCRNRYAKIKYKIKKIQIFFLIIKLPP